MNDVAKEVASLS